MIHINNDVTNKYVIFYSSKIDTPHSDILATICVIL